MQRLCTSDTRVWACGTGLGTGVVLAAETKCHSPCNSRPRQSVSKRCIKCAIYGLQSRSSSGNETDEQTAIAIKSRNPAAVANTANGLRLTRFILFIL